MHNLSQQQRKNKGRNSIRVLVKVSWKQNKRSRIYICIYNEDIKRKKDKLMQSFVTSSTDIYFVFQIDIMISSFKYCISWFYSTEYWGLCWISWFYSSEYWVCVVPHKDIGNIYGNRLGATFFFLHKISESTCIFSVEIKLIIAFKKYIKSIFPNFYLIFYLFYN